MLKKSGEGELVFSNSAANTFQGGIDIAGGVIAFDNAGQLGSGTGGFIFSDSGTLRAAATVAGVLEGGMAIAAGKTATVEVGGGGVLVYSGTLASGPASSVLRKTGMGSLQIEGNNSAATGTVAIDAGSVILAADTASLGGAITVNTGATLGGIGSAGANGSVKVAAGGILDAGIDAAQSSTLTVTNLQLTGSAIVRLGLFTDAADATYQKSDRVIGAGTALVSGANIIDLTSFASGTFNLGNLTGLAANGSVTLSGMTIPSGGRLSAELGNAGGDLRLVTASDKSREVKWTGSGGATWNLVQKNWAAPGVDEFSYGDHVVFDGASDSANPQNRAILIDAQEVRVSDMTVQGGANHTFTGGGIHSSSGNVLADALGGIDLAGATGKLIKQGGGTLAFANAKNTFLGGVDIGGGVISVTNGTQLSTSDTTGNTFPGDATLRVAADDVVLDDTITI
ncbi:MAG: autotransporter-associated beta strand repeat-containing protein, partial [Opitutaceae bacterium]|nr:autotransporter-associated beta strand repeat-containing protein [Opitutaceae bacterium]